MTKLHFLIVVCITFSALGSPIIDDSLEDIVHVAQHEYFSDNKALLLFDNDLKKQIKEHKVKQRDIICEDLECSACVDVAGFALSCTNVTMMPDKKQMIAAIAYGDDTLMRVNLTVKTHSYECHNLPAPMDFVPVCCESNGIVITANTMKGCFQIFSGDIMWNHCALYDFESRKISMD